MVNSEQVGIHEYIKMGTINWLQREDIPDIAEIKIPSPITMQVPARTRIRIVWHFYNSCSIINFIVFATNYLSWKVY